MQSQNILQSVFYYFFIALSIASAKAQIYTSYFTGDTADVSPQTLFGICLMGGATENDNAMKWFLNKSGGGDVVVIRVSGTDGYNDYMYTDLGINLNSVETIIIPSIAAANDSYVNKQLRNAEAIWIAGGDQWDYVSFWKNTLVDSALNDHVNIKNAPIGGTSAGMAILGGNYFSAENGTITSSDALSNPFDALMTIGHNDFLEVPFFSNVITDTHYDNPDRKGRHIAFIARLANDYGERSFGIACDEYTAVCIDSSGKAIVYGEYPNYDDNAYFLQANCVSPFEPEICTTSTPLTWDRNHAAVKVYAVKGTLNASNYFNVTDWETGSGGSWEDWYVDSGTLYIASGIAADCNTSTIKEMIEPEFDMYPNPADHYLTFSNFNQTYPYSISIYNINGTFVLKKEDLKMEELIDISALSAGCYIVKISSRDFNFFRKLVVQKSM